MIGNLSLEELIALKLELAFRSVKTPIFGIPIWRTTPKIVRDAVIKYTLAATGSKLFSARLLGMNNGEFSNYLTKLGISEYYKKKEKKGDGDSN
jgi:hypothetical protein